MLDFSFNEYRHAHYYNSKIFHFWYKKPYETEENSPHYKEWDLYKKLIETKTSPMDVYDRKGIVMNRYTMSFLLLYGVEKK